MTQVSGDTCSTMNSSFPLSASIILQNPIAQGFSTAANKAVAIAEVHNSLLLFFFDAAIASVEYIDELHELTILANVKEHQTQS